MKKLRGAQLGLAFVSLVLGLALALQFRNVQRIGGIVSLQRTEDLTRRVEQLQQENDGLRTQIREHQNRITEFENAIEDEDESIKLIHEQLERARTIAGLTDVEGPGVVVTIDVKHALEWGADAIVQDIHFNDLLKLVNELNAAGAEAIAINDERIIATTEIRSAGNFIVINTNRYNTPFEIKAIGNPETLEASLKLLGGVTDELSAYLDIRIRRDDVIKISKYRGQLDHRFAQPVQGTN
jgi:uncharacterized protein YlxW (UPF0749 family)